MLAVVITLFLPDTQVAQRGPFCGEEAGSQDHCSGASPRVDKIAETSAEKWRTLRFYDCVCAWLQNEVFSLPAGGVTGGGPTPNRTVQATVSV